MYICTFEQVEQHDLNPEGRERLFYHSPNIQLTQIFLQRTFDNSSTKMFDFSF